ncbi:MAG: hypothetical protein ACTHKZ_09655 [Lysobacteraceae bacterium]
MRCLLGILLLLASASVPAAVPAEGVVARLYRDFAWEAVVATPHAPGLAQQPKAVLLRYFTPALASAIAADAACAARTAKACALDFMPLWASQDPAAVDLSIAPAGPATVRVTYRVPASGAAVTLVFRMESTGAGWRIADVVYPQGPSLAALLAPQR